MARCEDCFCHKACEDFAKSVSEEYCTCVELYPCKNFISTADVVPKSEVEQLKRDLEQCENGYRQHIHLLQCKFADEKREIFAEIEKLLKRTCEKGYCGSISDLLAELKKKYTENCTTCAHMVSCEPNPFGHCEGYEERRDE